VTGGDFNVTAWAFTQRLAEPTLLVLVASLAGMGMPRAQTAGDPVSTYTSSAQQDCRTERPPRKPVPEDGGTRECPGTHGFVVVVSENDLRETVSVGRNRALADKEPAARKSFGPFSSAGTTVEWRSQRLKSRPYAIIQRWSLADNNDLDKDGRPRDKQMLVVTRLPPGAVCQVAYIDVAANANANELARKAADEVARKFDCAKDKIQIVGTAGRATELAQ
jgi:hypothetical protein